MSKKQQIEDLFDDLIEALHDASHNYTMDRPKKAAQFMALADKITDTIKMLTGDDFSWECKEPHCFFKHNSRGSHA